MRLRLAALLVLATLPGATLPGIRPALAQMGPGGPPAVGVTPARQEPIIETNEFVGRIQAVHRVDLVARVTAFLEKRFFVEGSEVKAGEVLYQLEQGPFQADAQAKQAAVAQAQAQLKNATLTLQRAQALLNTAAGQQSTVDTALATQQTDAAQVAAAQANLKQSEINLGYTQIRSPIDGKIGQSRVSVGNVVSPSSGALDTVVSQDPMYVTFPISVTTGLELRNRYADRGGFSAVVIKLRLPDGAVYNQEGRLDFADISVATTTDTITLRGTIPNPLRAGAQPNQPGNRELIDGEFVTVMLQAAEPIQALAVPRAAVLSDQQGNYVFVVGKDNTAEQRRVTLGQSTPDVAVVSAGLKPGELVVVDGIQRVRPGIKVVPGPATPGPGIGTQAIPAASLGNAPTAAGAGTQAPGAQAGDAAVTGGQPKPAGGPLPGTGGQPGTGTAQAGITGAAAGGGTTNAPTNPSAQTQAQTAGAQPNALPGNANASPTQTGR